MIEATCGVPLSGIDDQRVAGRKRFCVRLEPQRRVVIDRLAGKVEARSAVDELPSLDDAEVLDLRDRVPADPHSSPLAYPLGLALDVVKSWRNLAANYNGVAVNELENLITSHAGYGGAYVWLAAGDLTNAQDLPQLIKCARRAGLMVGVECRAGKSPQDYFNKIASARPAEIRLLVYGASAQHDAICGRDSFDATSRTAARLVQMGIAIRLVMVVDAANVLSWLSVAVAAERLGCKLGFVPRRVNLAGGQPSAALSASEWNSLVAQVANMLPVLPRVEPVQMLYRTLPAAGGADAGFSLRCGETDILIDGAGDCYRCCMLIGQTGCSLGNIFNQSLADVWRRAAEQDHDLVRGVPRTCSACQYGPAPPPVPGARIRAPAA